MVHPEGNALLKAVWQGQFRLTRLLLEGGAYINEGNTRGETPLIAACLAPYGDARDRARMVRYLLENGADPNIPDQAGKSALMHACAHGAGAQVAAVLLGHGADPSARDYAGASPLVYALERGDRETLQVLLDACQAKGKEVIIITSDTSPSGTKKTRQYLNSPPSPGLVGGGKAPPPAPPCMSPSDIEVRASQSPGASEKEEARDVFDFPPAARGSGSPLLPKGDEEDPRAAPLPPAKGRPKTLKRLNSEPWGLVAPSAALVAGGPHMEKARTPEERLTADMKSLGLSKRFPLSRRHSMEGQESGASGLFKMAARLAPEEELSAAAWAEKVQGGRLPQAPCRPGAAGPEPPPEETGPRGPAPAKPWGGLEARDPEARRAGSIPGSPDPARVPGPERRKPEGSLEGPVAGTASPLALRHRPPGLLERRGSGTLLLDHLSQSRPGFLPPLPFSPHPPLRDPRANGKAASPAHLGPSPGGPAASPSKSKRLWRRHSMQTEEMRQLVSFQNLLAQGDSVAS